MQISHKQFQAIKSKGRLSQNDIERLDKGLDPIPLEDWEAERLATYIRCRTKTEFSDKRFDDNDPPGIIHSTHIGNESGQRGTANIVSMMKKKKRLGVNKGFPDYIILARDIWGEAVSFAIELKRTSGSTTSKEQKHWIKCLSLCGIPSSVAKGSAEAIEIIENRIGKI